MRSSHRFPLGLILSLALASAGHAYKEVAPPEKVELPAAKTPAESRAAIRVPAGFEVQLVAAEPLVQDPIDIAWGPDGKLWVVEMADYPLGLDGKGKPGGRIRFLESSRGDGIYDRSTLFAEGLRFPTSVLPWRGGVLVTAVPDVLLLEDTDGDGRADRSTPVLTGLAIGNPQHLANSLQWGLDGWVYLANGDSGGKVTSRQVTTPLTLGRRDFRIGPDDGHVELLEGQTQAGRVRDDWGSWFGCNNSNPLWHYALEDRYLRRNPAFVPPNALVSIASQPGAGPVFPASRTLARFNDPHGFNHFTSACGLALYRDDWLGADLKGNAFTCEPVHNLVHREVLSPAGATFAGRRAPGEETSEFLASADNWSRFTAVRPGPDGALYVVDMYRLVIEHPTWIPAAWQKVLGDIRAGEQLGRIYRVVRQGAAARPVPRLDTADATTLAAALASPSGVVRDLAQQQFAWRRPTGAASAVLAVARTAARPEARAQALWTLRQLGALDAATVAAALDDPHPGVKRQAVRVSEDFAATQPDLLAKVARQAQATDGALRQQVAYTLGEWRGEAASAALAELLRDNEDRYVRAAAMSSAGAHAEAILAHLGSTRPADDPLLVELAAVTANARALANILAAIAAPVQATSAAEQFQSLARLLDWLQRNRRSLRDLEAMNDRAVTAGLAGVDPVFAHARSQAADDHVPLATRTAAVRLLGRGRGNQDADFEILAALLAPKVPGELQLAAVGALAQINRPTVPERLLAGWNGHSPALRRAILDAVISRPAWAHVLLDRAEKDADILAGIDSGRREALTQHSSVVLAKRAVAVFRSAVNQDRQAVIDRYLAAMPPRNGSAVRGGKIFADTCAACHRFGDVAGGAIGPDIASVKDRSADYLVTHILDPNRAVEERYKLYTATLQDGREVAGMLVNEAGHSITVRTLDGVEHPLLRSDLVLLFCTGRSLMPEGLEGAITPEQMRDLVTFLSGGQ
jgi:putative membrane-bound dehydrogenase-like protein